MLQDPKLRSLRIVGGQHRRMISSEGCLSVVDDDEIDVRSLLSND